MYVCLRKPVDSPKQIRMHIYIYMYTHTHGLWLFVRVYRSIYGRSRVVFGDERGQLQGFGLRAFGVVVGFRKM